MANRSGVSYAHNTSSATRLGPRTYILFEFLIYIANLLQLVKVIISR